MKRIYKLEIGTVIHYTKLVIFHNKEWAIWVLGKMFVLMPIFWTLWVFVYDLMRFTHVFANEMREDLHFKAGPNNNSKCEHMLLRLI